MSEQTPSARGKDLPDFLDTLPVPVFALSRELTIVFWNRECECLTGWQRQDVLNSPGTAGLLNPEAQDGDPFQKEREALGGKLRQWESTVRCRDGGVVRIAWTTFDAPAPRNDLGCWCIGSDVTHRWRTFEHLEKSERYYRSLVDGLQSGLCRWKPDTTLTFVNARLCEMLECDRQELLGRRWLDYLPESVRKPIMEEIDLRCRSRECARRTHCMLTGNQSLKWFEWQDTPVLDDDGKLIEYQSTGMDITDCHNRLRILDEAEESRLRAWGMELHDSVMQKLTATLFMLEVAEDAVYGQESLRDLVRKSLDLVKESFDEIDNLSQQLFPVTLCREGFCSALEELACHVENVYGVKCRVHKCYDAAEDTDLDSHLSSKQTASVHLFRIAQEAAGNAVKHGQAGHIEILLQKCDKYYELTIQDDGCGFDIREANTGVGLESMRHRASLINGTLSLYSAVGSGATVRCRIPVLESVCDGEN